MRKRKSSNQHPCTSHSEHPVRKRQLRLAHTGRSSSLHLDEVDLALQADHRVNHFALLSEVARQVLLESGGFDPIVPPDLTGTRESMDHDDFFAELAALPPAFFDGPPSTFSPAGRFRRPIVFFGQPCAHQAACLASTLSVSSRVRGPIAFLSFGEMIQPPLRSYWEGSRWRYGSGARKFLL